jgi:hypothetical protein
MLEPNGHGDAIDLATCNGYVSGVVDGGLVASAGNENGRYPLCVPSEVTRLELVRVVLKYGNDHPEKLHWLAGRLVVEALSTAFPCTTK